MASSVRIPTVLRSATAGQATLTVEGATVGEILGKISADYPAIRAQLFNDDGTLHRFLNIYVNDDDVRYVGGLDATVAPGDEVTLLPAVAGGSGA